MGDSNIVLCFTGWIDQEKTNFGRARSLAIRVVTSMLDEQGFTMPEPIYRLRFDNTDPIATALEAGSNDSVNKNDMHHSNRGQSAVAEMGSKRQMIDSDRAVAADKLLDVSPDTHLEAMVNDERAQKHDDDLLDPQRPVE